MEILQEIVFQAAQAFVSVIVVCLACYVLPYLVARGIREGWNGR